MIFERLRMKTTKIDDSVCVWKKELYPYGITYTAECQELKGSDTREYSRCPFCNKVIKYIGLSGKELC